MGDDWLQAGDDPDPQHAADHYQTPMPLVVSPRQQPRKKTSHTAKEGIKLSTCRSFGTSRVNIGWVTLAHAKDTLATLPLHNGSTNVHLPTDQIGL